MIDVATACCVYVCVCGCGRSRTVSELGTVYGTSGTLLGTA